VLLGFRSLRERDHYADDPLVARVCGVRRLADVATLSRRLGGLDTLRHRLIHRAGRLTRPHGTLTLTMSANASARDDIER
jgi:hypothetical protein